MSETKRSKSYAQALRYAQRCCELTDMYFRAGMTKHCANMVEATLAAVDRCEALKQED